MRKIEKVIYFCVFSLIIAGTIIARVNHDFFQGTYVVEDGVIEWLTVVALISGSILCFKRAIALRKERKFLFLAATVCLGLIFLFGAGEEISWGQRIFDVKSPDFFVANNSQQETNLHNLVVSGKKINKLIFGTLLGILIAIYFLIIPVVYRKMDKFKKLIDSFAIPIPKNIHIILYIFLFALATASGSPKKGELLEFGGCWIFFMMILFPYNLDVYKKKILK